MSASPRRAARAPAWVNVALVPAANLALALLLSGGVVLLVGENPAPGAPHPRGRRLRQRRGHRLHALLRDQLRLHGPGGGRGVPRRALQHRRRGPGLHRRARRGAPLPRRRRLAGGPGHPGRRSSWPRPFGAAWAFVPAWLQARRGSHVVITTIMFNFIAAALMTHLLVNVLIKPGPAVAGDARVRPEHLAAPGPRGPPRRSAGRSAARRSTSRRSWPSPPARSCGSTSGTRAGATSCAPSATTRRRPSTPASRRRARSSSPCRSPAPWPG